MIKKIVKQKWKCLDLLYFLEIGTICAAICIKIILIKKPIGFALFVM